MNSPTVPTVTKAEKSPSIRGLWAICLGSFGSAALLIGSVMMVANSGCKQISLKSNAPVYQYYVTQSCYMAYDSANNKVFYLHNNGLWYDFPPQIRQYTY